MAQVLIRQHSPDPLAHCAAALMRRRPHIKHGVDAGAFLLANAARFSEYTEGWVGDHKLALKRWYEDRCVIYTAQEGNQRFGGFAVTHGELELLHHHQPGHGDWLMRAALDAGAHKLTCFDIPELLSFYTKHGFRTTAVVTNTDNRAHPAVHYMTLN